MTKATGWIALTLTATPSFVAGANFHFRTASKAALFSCSSVELTTTGLTTSPLAVIVKLITTFPSTHDARREGEYAGADWRMGVAFSRTAADNGVNADTLSAAAR